MLHIAFQETGEAVKKKRHSQTCALVPGKATQSLQHLI